MKNAATDCLFLYASRDNCQETCIAEIACYICSKKLIKGAMGDISVILVKNYFFILLHKFNLHNLIYDFLKFQNSDTDVQSYVNFYAI